SSYSAARPEHSSGDNRRWATALPLESSAALNRSQSRFRTRWVTIARALYSVGRAMTLRILLRALDSRATTTKGVFMDRRTATVAILALGFLGTGAIAYADSAPKGAPTLPAGTAATLSRQLTDAVGRGDTPGVVALVVNRDGVLYEGAAG